jgi:hypothetical protein
MRVLADGWPEGVGGRRPGRANAVRDAAKVRLLNAEAAYLEAQTRLTEAHAKQLSEESTKRLLQSRRLVARIKLEEAETAAVHFARFQGAIALVVFLLAVALVFILAVVDPSLLRLVGGTGVFGLLIGFVGGRYSVR